MEELIPHRDIGSSNRRNRAAVFSNCRPPLFFTHRPLAVFFRGLCLCWKKRGKLSTR